MGIFGPVRINQPIELEINLMSGPVKYKSRIEGLSEDTLVVGTPIVNGSVLPIRTGTIVTVSYLDNVALYTFKTRVLAVYLKPIPTLTLGRPYDIKRVQRRNFVRIHSRIPLKFTRLKENLERCSDSFEGTTIDISGGGTMFSTEVRPELDDLLEVNLFLPDDVEVIALGKVVRVFEKKQGTKNIYSVGVEFTIIEEGERDKIIRYIFNQQRELRRKGLL